ncbi:sensor histidine kinase [Pararobbsia alpina]|uniref:histidine kinase n=1 Tax=Pararobbsia alpina TaxID=621374 RepID=A0A6S7B138_9BURK|nr:HAMP domain-containing sensor histidine kinase [Pararobbsia alpina]CAB3783686.1 Signal transduction histidine-protein kinase/phosphatase MprB [Pararobbsia alpina]
MIATDLKISVPSSRLGRRWHTSTFRWLSIYAVVFVLSSMSLLSFVELSVTHAMEREADSGIRWQLRYFDSLDDSDVSSDVGRRIRRERLHSDYYGFFDSDGRHLAGNITSIPPGLTLDNIMEAHSLFEGRTVALRQGATTPIVRVIGERRADGTQLVVARNLAEVEHIRAELIKALILGGMLCLAASLITAFVLSLRQMRRIADMQRATLQIARGDLKQRLPAGGGDELDMLSHLVNYMLDEVERLMNEVKGACDGIAHDLRTPLAHVRTLLAGITDRARVFGDERLEGMLAHARLETESLLERFRAMLRISEIGALQRRGGFEMLSLQRLVDDLCNLYRPLAEERSIRLQNGMTAVPPIHGDRALLFEAFSNLLDNAIKFAPNGGVVCVELQASTAGPSLVVSDNGPGIPEHERHAVLQRFNRGEAARHVAGFGLGLGIVSAIMRMHDFGLTIGSANPGAVMTVECWPHTLE